MYLLQYLRDLTHYSTDRQIIVWYSPQVKAVGNSKMVAVSGKVVPLVHVYSCSFVGYDLQHTTSQNQVNPCCRYMYLIEKALRLWSSFVFPVLYNSDIHIISMELGQSLIYMSCGSFICILGRPYNQLLNEGHVEGHVILVQTIFPHLLHQTVLLYEVIQHHHWGIFMLCNKVH